MIESAAIVNDTRRVRSSISQKFKNDADKYIDYLISQEKKGKRITESEINKKRPNKRLERTP
jgi:hypothetical protein